MKSSLLFLGTPDFAVPILDRLHSEHDIIAVITQPDKPVGRKQVLTAPPIKVRAEELGLTVLQPEKASEIPNLITKPVDFLVTAAYGQYLPTKVLELPTKDALNVHPSLLPLYRGATPMQSALLHGDEKTGVSIIRMVKEMDAGPIFTQMQFPLEPEWKYPELEIKCSQVGADLISNVIDNYSSMNPQEQQGQVTTCTKITKQDGQIHWADESATRIHNKLRAFTPWPGIYTIWKDQKLSFLDITPFPDKLSEHTPGTVYQDSIATFIQCEESSIELHDLQLAGKKPTNIKDFLNGYPDFIGSTL